MPKNTLERDEHLLLKRITGASTSELGAEYGIGREAARVAAERAGRRHVESVLLEIWLAQKQGEILGLACPPDIASTGDEAAVHAYFEWVLVELAKQGVEPRVHYRPVLGGGFVMFVEDGAFHPRLIARGGDE